MPTYRGFAYRQTTDASAPYIVNFVAPSEELLQWAGIPRRSEVSQMGFQRPEEPDRVSKTKTFFSMPPNQSPTALIVGIHPPLPGRTPDIEIRWLEAIPRSAITPVELLVRFPLSPLGSADVVSRIRAQLAGRLGIADQETANTEEELEEHAADAGAEGEDAAGQGQEPDPEGGEDELELGSSQLAKLRDLLEDPAWVEANVDSLRDLAKPATIIDGQHRVLGAASCERSIPFAVCALIPCSWPEQVFQFTVVNYKAEGIPDQFITANAALSLTELELAGLQQRLIQAQVKVIEYELMRVVNFDKESPFFELVNLTERPDSQRIGYKTMVKVAKMWYAARIPVIRQMLLPNLFPQFRGRGSARRQVDEWKREAWGQFFKDFWTVVHDAFQDETTESGQRMWTVGESNLMIAVVLLELQGVFFQDLNAQDEEFFAVPAGNDDPMAYLRGRIRVRAQRFVSYIPPRFFAIHWGTTSLNTSIGRVALRTALENLWKNKGKYQYEKSTLVTGRTDVSQTSD